MSPAEVGGLLEGAIATIFAMAAPMLLAGLAVGLLVALFQAVTQINEVTLVFVPKMLAVGLGLWIAGPWVFDQLHGYFAEVLRAVQRAGPWAF